MLCYSSPMFYSLCGTAAKLTPPQVALDVSGVSYLLTVPLPTWEAIDEGARTTLIIYTYVREDRLDLFGFAATTDRKLFSELIALSGIGPKIALELCSIPRSLLMQAIGTQDPLPLTQIKGIGRKMSEKLLVDLKALYEKYPEMLGSQGATTRGTYDPDAMAALVSLGYDQSIIARALREVEPTITKTEDKVTAVLRSLGAKNRSVASSLKHS